MLGIISVSKELINYQPNRLYYIHRVSLNGANGANKPKTIEGNILTSLINVSLLKENHEYHDRQN